MSDEFLRLIAEADLRVRKDFPQARFCTATRHGLYENSPWTFVFRVNGKSIQTIHSQGDFSTPEVLEHPPTAVRDIPLPLPLGLEQAELVLHNTNVHGVITHIELSWANYPGVDQPYYMFEMGGEEIWFVGVRDRKVQKSPLRETANMPLT